MVGKPAGAVAQIEDPSPSDLGQQREEAGLLVR
jgi:hypothetical protein